MTDRMRRIVEPAYDPLEVSYEVERFYEVMQKNITEKQRQALILIKL